ncbi:MAG: ZIP family metal transporter [Nitrosotalea sp.]
MVDFIATLVLSAIMGLSVYLSLPIVLRKKMGDRKIKFLNAAAVGILVFLMADIYSDVGPILLNGSLQGYGTSPFFDGIFGASVAIGFLVLHFLENRSKKGLSPIMLALIIAIAMGFQNLSEGLVYGASSVQYGLVGTTLVILVGFTIQNLTEGFPIAAPLAGKLDKRLGALLLMFLIGGVPTIVGGGIGYYYNSNVIDLIFYGLAIGTILYVILPMFRILFKESDVTTQTTYDEKLVMKEHPGRTLTSVLNQRAVYIGLFVGFMVGWLVNLV